jgi:hypothetical protein
MSQRMAQPKIPAPGGRCRHGLLAAQCAQCNQPHMSERTGPHLGASAVLRCRECHLELIREDANRTSLVGLLMRLRREHSRRVHPDIPDILSPAEVALRCEVCMDEFDTLDINATSLGNEIMSCRSDHERARHT